MTEETKQTRREEGKTYEVYEMLEEVGSDIDGHLREGRLVTALLLADNLEGNVFGSDVDTKGIYAGIAVALERKKEGDLTPAEKRILDYVNSKAYKTE